jgi:uncharacterized protein YkwD
MKVSLIFLLIIQLNFNVYSQNTFNCSSDEFNVFVLKEVNRHRKKAKVHPLSNDNTLKMAGIDHSNYMAKKDKLTHYQKNRVKKTPKNRVDYYGEQFDIVGENVLQNWLIISKKHDVKTCQDLAEVLVDAWRNSPPHYANMISEDYTTTYTSFNISDKGKIYACQLFGSDAYHNSYKDSILTFVYKPDKGMRCKRCETKFMVGSIQVIDDSLIVYSGNAGPLWRFKTKYYKRRPRFNWFDYAIAADIVLKEQYDCDTNIVFNGKTGVRGIPLEPVFKKDFRKGKNIFFWKFIDIEVGTIPEWIDQDYEVNLTVINNKRTCTPITYNVLPTDFHVDIKLDLYLDSLNKYYHVPVTDSLTFRLDFEKSKSKVNETFFTPLDQFVRENYEDIKFIEITGKSSIEGSSEQNIVLYKKRTKVLSDRLIELGIDSSLVSNTSSENFEDFRTALKGTEYAFLLKKNNTDLKEIVNKKYTKELEYILEKQRYAEVSIQTLRYEKKSFKKDTLYQLFNTYLNNNDIRNCKKMQAIEYGLLLNNELNLSDFINFEIEPTKKHVDLLCDRYLVKFQVDSLNVDRTVEFMNSLISLRDIDKTNSKVNTNLTLLEYKKWIELPLKQSKKYFDTLVKRRYIDPVIKARMILNYATTLDWRTFYYGFSKKYLFESIKKHIKPAKLNARDKFELATYYAFFEDYRYAYLLSKKMVYKNSTFDETVFFLKLIYYLDSSLSRKTVLKHFKRIAHLKGKEFCKYFNSPNLNFQILDDIEIRKIYCETCSN